MLQIAPVKEIISIKGNDAPIDRVHDVNATLFDAAHVEIVSINEIESHVFIKLNTSQSFIINKTQIDDYKNFYNQLNLIAEQQNIPFNKMLNWKW